jgi:DNA-binding NarL/FixJ family response regulator
MATLFVIDSHPVVRLGIRTVVEQAGHVIAGEACTASAAAMRDAETADAVIVTIASDRAAVEMSNLRAVFFERRADLADLLRDLATVAGDESLDAGAAHDLLSPREREVASLILAGRRPKEIGHSLGLSPKTVSTHRVRIFRKLAVDGDLGLLRYAMQHQLS